MNIRNILKSAMKRIGVTRINSISKYDELPIYVYQACRPNSIHLTVDSGKGKTDEDAFIACAVESIERYTAENVTNKRIYVETSNANLFMPNKKFISTDRCANKIDTYKGMDLIDKREIYVPTNYVDYRIPKGPLSSHAFTGTTGLGAHRTRNRAICSGLVELIERDAIAKGHFEKINLKEIDESLCWIEKQLEERADRYAILRYETDWPIEVVQIICDEPYVNGGMNAMGVGESLKSAIEDAALEAMQTWLMRIAASRDDWAYSRVMNKHLFDELLNSAVKIKKTRKGNDLMEQKNKYTNDLYEKLIKHASLNSQKVIVVPLENNANIPEIVVVKVFIETMSLLRQGPMITGIPYMPSHP